VSRASAGANAERREHLDPVPENLPLSVDDVYAEYHDKIRWAINSMGAEVMMLGHISRLQTAVMPCTLTLKVRATTVCFTSAMHAADISPSL